MRLVPPYGLPTSLQLPGRSVLCSLMLGFHPAMRLVHIPCGLLTIRSLLKSFDFAKLLHWTQPAIQPYWIYHRTSLWWKRILFISEEISGSTFHLSNRDTYVAVLHFRAVLAFSLPIDRQRLSPFQIPRVWIPRTGHHTEGSLLSMPTSNPVLLLAQQKPFCRGLLPLTCSVSFREGTQLMPRLTVYLRGCPFQYIRTLDFHQEQRTCEPALRCFI